MSTCGILLLVPNTGIASGNYTTMRRIKKGLMKNLPEGIQTLRIDFISAFVDKSRIEDEVRNLNIRVVIALHAAHCANALSYLKVPYILIFGGTDLNEYSRNESILCSMKSTVENASVLVSFGESMQTRALELWPHLNVDKLWIVPQAVETGPSTFSFRNFLKKEYGIESKNIFLLIASIRKVKDPLYLVKEFSEWHRNGNMDSLLLIIGSKVDYEFFNHAVDMIKRLDGVLLHEPLSSEDTQAAIEQSTALINSSTSEGMASSILEAMDLETPVVARNIPGNRDVITHMVNGLLFSTPQEFVKAIESVLKDESLVKQLVCNAKQKIIADHSCYDESQVYKNLIETLI